MVRLQIFLLIVAVLTPASISAECVQFDVAHTVAAEEVSTEDFIADYPNHKLVRIRIPISSLVRLEDESSLAQFLYVVSGTTTNSFQVVDYAPKTTLASDVTGLISSESSSDDSTSIGVSALAPHDFPVKAEASAKHNVGSHNARRMDILPPKQLLSASGTMHRGLSAYFKLKPSSQTTLEGTKLFEITVRVNRSWRASLLQVKCAAISKSGNVVCGQSGFIVGVHMAGDDTARQSVERLASAQYQLQHLARQHKENIEEQRYPSVGHKLGAALSIVKPKIPESWLKELLNSGDFHSFERHLPRPIRAAATDYRQARSQVIEFAG